MKELWNPKESVRSNMTTMGVAFDANEILSNKSTKATFIEKAKSAKSPETPKIVEKTKTTENSGKTEVIKRLEAQVSEAENNKKSNFRFTPDQVKWITYCLDKHGDDFKVNNTVFTTLIKSLRYSRYLNFGPKSTSACAIFGIKIETSKKLKETF